MSLEAKTYETSTCIYRNDSPEVQMGTLNPSEIFWTCSWCLFGRCYHKTRTQMSTQAVWLRTSHVYNNTFAHYNALQQSHRYDSSIFTHTRHHPNITHPLECLITFHWLPAARSEKAWTNQDRAFNRVLVWKLPSERRWETATCRRKKRSPSGFLR